jgi:hypothetical protein
VSFQRNLREILAQLLPRSKPEATFSLEIKINNWQAPDGDRNLPTYFGACRVTPKFLHAFRDLCEKHKLGE